MDNWRSALKGSVSEWLLDEDAPSVRYQTLKYIMGKPETDIELISAKQAVMKTGIVPAILEGMGKEEYAQTLPKFYRDKYSGLSWQLIILAELEAEGGNAQIKKYCEYILANSQEKESGAFSVDRSEKAGGGLKSGVIPCLTGNMVYSLIRLGYLEDARTQKAIDWIVKYQRFDDGDEAPAGEPYDRYEMCWGKHSCFMGVVKALKALTEIPEHKRTPEVSATIERGAEYLLKHHIYKKSHDLSQVSKPGWLKFSFPLMYQTDALEILLIFAKLGIKDARLRDALDTLISKQDEKGIWTSQSSLRGEFLADIKKEERNKWITLRALRVLKYYYPD